jgi:serine phosphatase RsbU (regulator of sigma subunit)
MGNTTRLLPLFRCIWILFLILLNTNAFSQNAKLDSLKRLLLNTPEDTTKANLLIKITKVYLYDLNDRDSMQAYSEKNLALSKKLNYKKGIAYAYNFMGIVSWGKSDLEKALDYYTKGLALMREAKELNGEASCLANIGYVHYNKGNFALAADYTMRAIRIKGLMNDKRGMAACYNNLGNIYQDQSNYKEALVSHIKALKLREEIKDSSGIATSYINIALVFEAQNKADDALFNYQKALNAASAVGDKYAMADALNNMGTIYKNKNNFKASLEHYNRALKLYKGSDYKMGEAVTYNGIGAVYLQTKNYNEALHYQLKSLQIHENGGFKKGSASTYNSLGDISSEMKNYNQAVIYYKKALDISTAINSRDVMRDAYKSLSTIYEKLNDKENTIKYLKLYYEEKDSLLNKENFRQIYEINTRFETEKKEKEIELLTKDQIINEKTAKQQKIVRIALTVGLGLLGILLFSLYGRYRFKQRANLLLEQQKKEILKQSGLITDSIDYAKTIQEAILPDNEKLTSFLPDYFILYKPKATVSGDFYWIDKKGDQIICAVADCTGHGVPGAFMSILGQNILENVVQRNSIVNPGSILTMLNKEIVARFYKNEESVKHGMDVGIIMMDEKHQQVQYAGARNSLYLVRENTLNEIKADRFSIGTVSRELQLVTFTNNACDLKKDDMLYLFSDGFPDQKGGPDKKKFFYQPFKDLLVSISNLPVSEQKQQLDEAITQWMNGNEQIDDILVMGIRC